MHIYEAEATINPQCLPPRRWRVEVFGFFPTILSASACIVYSVARLSRYRQGLEFTELPVLAELPDCVDEPTAAWPAAFLRLRL